MIDLTHSAASKGNEWYQRWQALQSAFALRGSHRVPIFARLWMWLHSNRPPRPHRWQTLSRSMMNSEKVISNLLRLERNWLISYFSCDGFELRKQCWRESLLLLDFLLAIQLGVSGGLLLRFLPIHKRWPRPDWLNPDLSRLHAHS